MGKKKILLICRNQLVLTCMQEHLESANYNVTPIHNSVEAACQLLQENNFDLVITDMKLEDNYVSGIKICQHAKGINRSTLVMAFTTFFAGQSANYKGFDGIIEKHLPIQEALHVIELLLK